MAANTIVFQPLKVGELTLSNRIALAPLTRIRATADHVIQGQYPFLASSESLPAVRR